MKKQLLFLLTIILSLNCFSQISFEKGYYIDNNNQKTKCLIKNADWKNNPTEFEYKLLENGESKIATIKSISEFGVDNISKYVRSTVNIDRSSNLIKSLSNKKMPVFNQDTIFLKLLIEGKANLYEYIEGSLIRYFYSIDNLNIEQLIYKRYETDLGQIGINNRFRQQLWTDLKCSTFKLSKIENIDYKKPDLIRFFTDYSKCYNDTLINFEPTKKVDIFNLTIRPRITNSSLEIEHGLTDTRDTNFGNKKGVSLGLEAELILPFNNNKWAIALEPTFQSFKEEKTNSVGTRDELVAKVKYKSIEIPLSIRHYFFLNNDSKLFINASYIFDLSSKSQIEFKKDNNSSLNSLDIKSKSPNLGFGLGYKQNDKYSLEIRYQFAREVLSDYLAWETKYKSFSIIFGYSLF